MVEGTQVILVEGGVHRTRVILDGGVCTGQVLLVEMGLHRTGYIGRGGSAQDRGHIGRGLCTGQVILVDERGPERMMVHEDSHRRVMLGDEA